MLAVRQQQSNVIHVQSQIHDEDDEQLNEEQREMTKKSLQLLNDRENYSTKRVATPIYGDDHTEDKVPNIQI